MADYGVIVRGGMLIDGTGRARRPADVAVDGDRVAALGELAGARADTVIDARGRIVCPGFIDVHTHDDRMLRDAGDMTPKVSQGVTTVVAGNCGISLAPLVAKRRPAEPLDLVGAQEDYRYPSFAAFVDELARRPPACNAALLVGHATLRLAAMDDTARPAGADETAAMRAMVDEAMQAGAIGLSTGLEYPPARCAGTAEILELAAVAGAAGGIYATHMRDYGNHAEEACREAARIGREAGVAVVISHFHCHSESDPGLFGDTLAWYEDCRDKGLEIAADAYPYAASSTSILPEFVTRKVRTLVTWSKPHPGAGGRWLDDIAAEWGVDGAAAARRLAPGGAIYFGRDEENVKRLMAHPGILVGSDGIPLNQHPHPRLWGTFPRVLGRYAPRPRPDDDGGRHTSHDRRLGCAFRPARARRHRDRRLGRHRGPRPGLGRRQGDVRGARDASCRDRARPRERRRGLALRRPYRRRARPNRRATRRFDPGRMTRASRDTAEKAA